MVIDPEKSENFFSGGRFWGSFNSTLEFTKDFSHSSICFLLIMCENNNVVHISNNADGMAFCIFADEKSLILLTAGKS